MRFDEASLQANGVAQDQIERLRQMRRGGVSGGEGYEYEKEYALLWMLTYVLRLVTDAGSPDGTVNIQGLGFVDDVIREIGGEFTYSQLKTSPEETWAREERRLEGDFRRQHRLCRSAQVRFRLELVVPSAERATRLRSQIPRGIRSSTQVAYFPRSGSLEGMLAPGNPVDAVLRELCPGSAQLRTDRRLLLCRAQEAWERCGSARDSIRQASAILQILREDHRTPIKTPGLRLDERAQRAIELASAVDGVRVMVEDGFARYQVGWEEGVLGRIDSPHFQRFVERMHQSPPQTSADFERLLP